MTETIKLRQIYNQDILMVIKERYGFSLDYIRKSLRGDRTGLLPEKIRKEYAEFEFESKKAIYETAQKI